MKLESISIKNLRSLVEQQSFSLCPLTLVVGANSTGKSTFIRTFPLLRQSIETITKGPILWFGRFVDFGVFKDAVSRNISNPEIAFGFNLTLHKTPERRSLMYYYPYLNILEDCTAQVTLIVAEDQKTAHTYARQIMVSLVDHQIEINAQADGTVQSLLLDGHPLKSSSVELTLRSGSSLFSLALSQKSPSGTSVSIEADWLNSRQLGAFTDLLMDHVGNLFHGKAARETRARFVRWLGLGSTTSLLGQVKKLASITATSADRAKHHEPNSSWTRTLQGLVLANLIPQVLSEIDNFLASTFRGVSYIGPLRATAERFYRQQDLAVDEVDPQGANLAMFLMGLSTSEQAEFSDWCQKSIGFNVEARSVGSHVSINLRDARDGGLFNIADMGFGYSQLLPVLATMWSALKAGPDRQVELPAIKRRIVRPQIDEGNLPKIIAIEQPELHLHPQLQGRLADLLCAIVNESEASRTRVHLVCETHSETIVNQIGKLVSNGKIRPDQVQVLVFEKKDGETGSTIRNAKYDSDGVLLNWPYGFFLPSED